MKQENKLQKEAAMMLTNDMHQFKSTKELFLEIHFFWDAWSFLMSPSLKNFEMDSETQVSVKLKVTLCLRHN